MCLSTVYGRRDGEEQELAQFVTSIEIDDSAVKLIDVMGRETVVEGRLKRADLTNGVVVVDLS